MVRACESAICCRASEHVQDILRGIQVPKPLACLLPDASETTQMTETSFQKMVVSAAQSPHAAARSIVQDLFERRFHGANESDSLTKSLSNLAHFHSRMVYGPRPWNKVQEWELIDVLGFKWLCRIAEQQAALKPELAIQTCDALSRCVPRWSDKLTDATHDVVSDQIQRMLEIAAKHVHAGRLNVDEFFVRGITRHGVWGLTPAMVEVLTVEQQCIIIQDVTSASQIGMLPPLRRLEWLRALSGEARQRAVQNLAEQIGTLDDSVLEFVRMELFVLRGWPTPEAPRPRELEQRVDASSKPGPPSDETTTVGPQLTEHIADVAQGTSAGNGGRQGTHVHELTPTVRTLERAAAAGSSSGSGARGERPSAAVEKQEAVAQASSDLAKAILLSKADMPLSGVPLSSDGVVILRLTRKARSPEVQEALTTSPTLSKCHQRVLEAGCDIMPDWAGGAKLLVPLTTEQLEESGHELSDHHVVALTSDVEHIRAALYNIRFPDRPKITFDSRTERHTPAAECTGAGTGGDGPTEEVSPERGASSGARQEPPQLAEEDDDKEIVDVVVECPFPRTDSSVGFPENPYLREGMQA